MRYRIPLATRQRSWANELICRAGIVLEEPRDVEKFVRMLRVAIRRASKDMVGLEKDEFWRGNVD